MTLSPLSTGAAAVPMRDIHAYTETLRTVHHAFVEGLHLPAKPRDIIQKSWERMKRSQIESEMSIPDYDPRALDYQLGALEETRIVNFDKIIEFLDLQLTPVLADTELLGVLTTADARVIRRFGAKSSLARADKLGFVYGAHWGENIVGTNAIGTAAVTGQPVQIYGPEHWCLTQHEWSCAASPMADPRTGRIFAILDISGPLRDAHPALLGYVHALTAQVQLQLQESQRRSIERLRAMEWATVSALPAPWVLVDSFGAVAAVSGVSVPERIGDGERLVPGEKILAGLGAVNISRLGEGFLLRPVSATDRPEYALNCATGKLEMSLAGEKHLYKLSPKHRSILKLLVEAEGTLELEDIAAGAWKGGTAASTSTVRAEMSRLRKRFPELVSQAPYRLLEPVALA